MELKRKIKILNKFMSNQNIEGICSFWIDEEIILGTTKPVETKSIWFYWRLPFEHIIESFEMEDEEFKDMLNSYIEKKFGIKIDKIM